MTTVMVFGTFDILHAGHAYLLNEAKLLGNCLIAVIALDSTVMEVKGKLPLNSQGKRLANMKRLGIADKVVLGNKGVRFKIIRDYSPDIICLGYDQDGLDVHKLGIKVIRLGPYHPEKYKSSKIMTLLGNSKKFK